MDSDRPDMATKQRITVFQSHEVAHMWLVNLFVLVLYGVQLPRGLETLPRWSGGTICI